jgi:hypothetical protein
VVLPSAATALVRLGIEDPQFGKSGASFGGARHAGFGRPSEDSVSSGAPSGIVLRQTVVHSDAPALVRNVGGGPHFGKFGGPLGVSATLPHFQWVLFPLRSRPFSSVYGVSSFFLVCLGGISSRLGSLRWGNLQRGSVRRKELWFTPG